MTPEESQIYIEDVITQCVVSFSKTYWLDEKDSEALRRVLRNELNLGFKHLITE